MNNKKLLVSIFIIAALFFGTWTYIKAEGEQITVCVKKSGLVYVIGGDFKRTECKKDDSLLSWNTSGQQGQKGDKGDTGKQGPQGPQGVPGQSLSVYDATGQLLGQLVGLQMASPTEYYTIAIENTTGQLRIGQKNIYGVGVSATPQITFERYMLFQNPNCDASSGVLTNQLDNFNVVFLGPTSTAYTIDPAHSDSRSVTASSFYNSDTNQCTNGAFSSADTGQWFF